MSDDSHKLSKLRLVLVQISAPIQGSNCNDLLYSKYFLFQEPAFRISDEIFRIVLG